MTKDGIVEAVQKMLGGSRAEAGRVVDGVFDTITKSLSSGEDVAVSGFGKFKVAHRKARTGRNPKTGAAVQIPATKVPRFSAGKALKDAVK
ncbi:MAG: DNA-binding protein HU [Candidatus Terrybacteria bacterium RIFCSPLOWO2_01_FULL_44_24]|uniref:DNA-binding protein HU n=1 Tax=Candidatus Terrybacteria bacterium RIFCSPHIGHO2_01_FULL_43_35 TaxID=1802361 RepID=A0A1G2PGQ8_9BACT|nr:MAG: DNA-binding protein HU [Candidatus Terrybacteria bacterium RIFCSPHIGHO2_01_FULL_43_35]OHA51040.1 MAG: DNA-binding protein HU [Candidatus Terrybacteria bacterium RIFCSPLOWO2_01_FULL_44_24]